MAVELMRLLLDSSLTVIFVETGADGVVAESNRAFSSQIGLPREETIGRALFEFFTAQDAQRLQAWLDRSRAPNGPVRLNLAPVGGAPFTLRCFVEVHDDRLSLVGEPEAEQERRASDQLLRLNNELAVVARESARRERSLRRAQQRLEETVAELRTSNQLLRRIQEVVPVCMKCGKVKGADAAWQTLIDYLRSNRVFLSHGYCPSCAGDAAREFGLDG